MRWREGRRGGRGRRSADAVARLEPEGRANRVVGPVEGRGLVLDPPRVRQAAARLAEEAGEEDRGAAAADAGSMRDVDQELAAGEAQRADDGGVVDREGAGAEPAEDRVDVPFFSAAADAGDGEAEARAVEEPRLAAALRDDPPPAGQVAVPVLEEAGEELRGPLRRRAPSRRPGSPRSCRPGTRRGRCGRCGGRGSWDSRRRSRRRRRSRARRGRRPRPASAPGRRRSSSERI